jgi:hypothetical protein
MKTEISEGTEDDLGLEAAVDAMSGGANVAFEDGINRGGDPNDQLKGRATFGQWQWSHACLGPLLTQLGYLAPRSMAGEYFASPAQYQAFPRATSTVSEWAPVKSQLGQSAVSHAHDAIAKRHRSLTPNHRLTLPIPTHGTPTEASHYGPRRFHPYAPTNYNRASSLDPASNQINRAIAPDTSSTATKADSANPTDFPLASRYASPFPRRQIAFDATNFGTHQSNIALSTAAHGLKAGADGDQVAAQKLADWTDSSKIFE